MSLANTGEAAGGAKAPPYEGAAGAKAPPCNEAPRALVVDDEAPIRGLLVKLLERRGFQVAAADTGEAALGMNGHEPLSLVLCDVRMPGLSGFDLYTRMTASAPQLASRFVFITGDHTSFAAEHPELRHVPLLAKPFTTADLDAVLARVGARPSA